MRVHLQNQPDDSALAVLRDALDDNIVVSFGDAPPADPTYSVLVSGRPSSALLNANPELNTLVIPFAGLPKVTRDLMREFPQINVHNLHHNAPATAELALALLLAAAKRVVPVDARFRKGDWSDRGQMQQGVQLAGRTAVVLGYGAIGQRVAKACAGMDMTVRAVARRARTEASVEVRDQSGLRELLSTADTLLVCLPATDETEGMLGASELALLPRQCVLVNVSRGPIINEQALFERLQGGHIFGAGLDVWWDYPGSKDKWHSTQPSRLPFHELENVVLSPHRGGHVMDTEAQRMRALAALLNAAAEGREIPNRMDMQAGY